MSEQVEIAEQGEVDEVSYVVVPDDEIGENGRVDFEDKADEVTITSEDEFEPPEDEDNLGSDAEATEDPAEPSQPEPTLKDSSEDTVLTPAVKMAMVHLFSIQDRLESAVDDHAEKAEVAKTAKKRVESLQEDLQHATRKLRDARNENEPDPRKYPLLDGPKAEINARFSKPEAIAPLPPDTFDEYCRRRAKEQRFDDLGLSPKVVEVLEDLGLTTIDKFRIKSDAVAEASASLTTIPGITEKRLDAISKAIERFYETCGEEWAKLHPESEEAQDAEDMAEAERRLADPEEVPIPFEQAVAEIEATETEEGGSDE